MNILKNWEESKKRAHYPTLRDPNLVEDNEGGAHFDFMKGTVTVGKQIVEQLVATGLDENQALRGIFDHEIRHYMEYPRTLATWITHGYFAEKVFGEQGNTVLQLFADMVVDTYSALRSITRDDVLATRTALQHLLQEPDSTIRGMNLEYLCKQANVQPYSSGVPDKVKELFEIDFSKPDEVGIYRYGKIIEDFLKDSSSGNGYNGQGKSLSEIIEEFSEQEVDQALREIMKDVSKEKFERVRDWVLKKRPLSQKSLPGSATGDLSVDEQTAQYYDQLSRMYPLVITKSPRTTEETRKFFGSTEKWRSGIDPVLILPHSSMGKILPGVTRAIKIDEKEKMTFGYEEPNVLIIEDTSGSMPNPQSTKSYAALSCCILARSYHQRGQYVGAINFDSGASVHPYSRDLDSLMLFLTAYKGGGTTVNLDLVKEMLHMPHTFTYDEKMIRKMVEQQRLPPEVIRKQVSLDMKAVQHLSDRVIDVYMITDGDISNQTEVLDYFANLPKLHRAAIILTNGKRDEISQYGDKIHICTVKDEKDLPYLAVREASRSLR